MQFLPIQEEFHIVNCIKFVIGNYNLSVTNDFLDATLANNKLRKAD